MWCLHASNKTFYGLTCDLIVVLVVATRQQSNEPKPKQISWLLLLPMYKLSFQQQKYLEQGTIVIRSTDLFRVLQVC